MPNNISPPEDLLLYIVEADILFGATCKPTLVKDWKIFESSIYGRNVHLCW